MQAVISIVHEMRNVQAVNMVSMLGNFKSKIQVVHKIGKNVPAAMMNESIYE